VGEAEGEVIGLRVDEADGSQEILIFGVEHIEREFVVGAPVSSSLKNNFFPVMLHPKGTAGVDTVIFLFMPKRLAAS